MKGEAKFKTEVTRHLKKIYGDRLWHVSLPGGMGQRAGVPDKLYIIDGRAIAVEFKNPNGKGRLGPKQEQELEAVKQAGGIALVARCWDDLLPILETFPPTQRMTTKGNAKTLKNATKALAKQ